MAVINIAGIASIRAESFLEASAVRIWLFDTRVRRVIEQPVEIQWFDERRRSRTYVPDFFVEYADGSWALIEVKSRYLLRRRWAELRPKLEAGREYARRRGGKFRLLTDLGIDPATLWNARFLLPFLRDFPGPEERQRIADAMAAGAQTIRDLLTRLSGDSGCSDWPRLIWHLVARRELRVDLTQRVSVTDILLERTLLPPSLQREIPLHIRRRGR